MHTQTISASGAKNSKATVTAEDIRQKLRGIRQCSTSAMDMQCSLMGLVCESLIEASANITDSLESRDVYMEDIRRFHEKFELAYNEGPRKLEPDMQKFRIKFMKEELSEYECAVATGNMEKQFDALIDLVYVALGTAYLQGLPFRKGWNRVQAANMRKVLAKNASESTRGYSKDVVKPKDWRAPDLTDLLQQL